MESKTIRFRAEHTYDPNLVADSYVYGNLYRVRLSLNLTQEEFDALGKRDIEVTISPIASPEERLREARLSAVLDCMHIAGNSENVAAFIVQTIERVDAEFVKGEK